MEACYPFVEAHRSQQSHQTGRVQTLAAIGHGGGQLRRGPADRSTSASVGSTLGARHRMGAHLVSGLAAGRARLGAAGLASRHH